MKGVAGENIWKTMKLEHRKKDVKNQPLPENICFFSLFPNHEYAR